MSTVVKEKFQVVDSWYRFEWQHRGSGHIHGLLWLKNAPNIEHLNIGDPEGIEVVRQYFDNLVSTMNPNSGEPLSAVHPCNRRLLDEDLSTDDADYIQLINTVRLYLYYVRIQIKFFTFFFFFWYQYLKILHYRF